jgi:PAS domain S-box-containing protein
MSADDMRDTSKEELIEEIKSLRQEILELKKEKTGCDFQELHDLFDNANDLIQSVSGRGEFLYVNKKWRDILGYSEEEVKQLDIFDIVHPDSQEHCRDVFQRILSGEIVSMVEADFITKKGRRISVEGNVNCRFDKGKPVATRAIFRDVTERRKKESREIIKGGSEHLKVAELIQICNFFVPEESVVSVTNRRGKVGEVYISKGKILHARTGKLSGKKALFRMLGWEAGVYAINQKKLEQEGSIKEPLEKCLLDGAREIDEFNDLMRGIEKEGNFVEVQYSDELMKRGYEPITAEVLSLAIKYKQINRILDECKYTDLETLKAILGLLQKGTIRTA